MEANKDWMIGQEFHCAESYVRSYGQNLIPISPMQI